MKNLILCFTAILWLALPVCLRSQQHFYTKVEAVVKDSLGNPYSDGSWQVNLDISGVPTGTAVTFQRSSAFQQSYAGQMDASGNFSLTLPDNNIIVPTGDTKWKFTFCEHYTTPTQSPAPVCFSLSLLITGVSMDITSQVQAASVPLNPINAGTVSGSLVPSADNSWNLGSASSNWAEVYTYGETLANAGWLSWFDAGGQQQNLMRLDGSNNLTVQSPLALTLYAIGASQNINLDPIGGGSTVITGPATVTGSATLNGGGAFSGTFSGSPTLSGNPTFSGTVNLSGSVTGSVLQGTDSKLLTAGTVSGTGSPLCTDASGGATTSGCASGGASDSTMTDVGYLAGNAAACSTTNSSCRKYILPNAHTLVRVVANETQAPSGCSTNASWGVVDLTSSTVLEALTPTATGVLDSGAISIAMSAGHQIGIGVTQTDAGCSTQPVAGVTATFE